MNARSTWTRNIAVALHHTRDYATKPFPFPLECVVSVYITSSRMPMSRSTLVHDVSPSYSPLTLICNARSANDWTWCSSTDSRDRWMINEERTNMYCPCSSPCLLLNIWIWNTRPCYRRKKMINGDDRGQLHETSLRFFSITKRRWSQGWLLWTIHKAI